MFVWKKAVWVDAGDKGCSLCCEGKGESELFVSFTLRQGTVGLLVPVTTENESFLSHWCSGVGVGFQGTRYLVLRRGRVLMFFVLSLSCCWYNWRLRIVCLLGRKGRLLSFFLTVGKYVG